MKKTYKKIHNDTKDCYFSVGKAWKRATFNTDGTYTTDDEELQEAIENCYKFKNGGIYIVQPPMQWIKIDRDENGFATEECEMFKPIE